SRLPAPGCSYRCSRTSATARRRRDFRRPDPPPRCRAHPRGKKTPEIISIIENLLEHDTAGDPITGLKWSRRTTDKIASLLAEYGFSISPNTVARLLHAMDYSLRVNQKKVATDSSPDRNLQFEYIADLRERFRRRHLPIISVDTKKRELVGLFKNSGVRWDRQSQNVYDHDFRSDSIGVAIPYGVYDILANHGSITIGVSHDTPAFAASAIAAWWHRQGRSHYAGSRPLLILADPGRGHGYRCRA